MCRTPHPCLPRPSNPRPDPNGVRSTPCDLFGGRGTLEAWESTFTYSCRGTGTGPLRPSRVHRSGKGGTLCEDRNGSQERNSLTSGHPSRRNSRGAVAGVLGTLGVPRNSGDRGPWTDTLCCATALKRRSSGAAPRTDTAAWRPAPEANLSPGCARTTSRGRPSGRWDTRLSQGGLGDGTCPTRRRRVRLRTLRRVEVVPGTPLPHGYYPTRTPSSAPFPAGQPSRSFRWLSVFSFLSSRTRHTFDGRVFSWSSCRTQGDYSLYYPPNRGPGPSSPLSCRGRVSDGVSVAGPPSRVVGGHYHRGRPAVVSGTDVRGWTVYEGPPGVSVEEPLGPGVHVQGGRQFVGVVDQQPRPYLRLVRLGPPDLRPSLKVPSVLNPLFSFLSSEGLDPCTITVVRRRSHPGRPPSLRCRTGITVRVPPLPVNRGLTVHPV